MLLMFPLIIKIIIIIVIIIKVCKIIIIIVQSDPIYLTRAILIMIMLIHL